MPTNPKLRAFTDAEVSALAESTDRLIVSIEGGGGTDPAYLPFLRQRRQMFLNELVARSALPSVGYVQA